jgi:hypothetical protein
MTHLQPEPFCATLMTHLSPGAGPVGVEGEGGRWVSGAAGPPASPPLCGFKFTPLAGLAPLLGLP